MYITRLEQCRIINFKAVSHSKKKMRKKKKKKNKYNENVLNNVHLSIKRILSEAPGRINLLANESYGQKWKIKNKYTLNSPSFVFDKANRRSLYISILLSLSLQECAIILASTDILSFWINKKQLTITITEVCFRFRRISV